MSRKIKRRITSLSYSLNKLYKKISTAKPSTLALSAVIIAAAIFLFGGGLYSVITKPLPAAYYGGRFIFLYPTLSEQFITDNIVATTLYALGFIGLASIYQSTKYAYKPRQAYMMFLVGICLLLIAYIYLEMTVQMKLRGG
ncbi:MAG: hypothetical protein QW270_05480 [Candidatus Bathyarchaeia archaeon]